MQRMASYFPWRQEYNINVKEMDKQHMALVGIINDLQQSINEGEGKESLGKILKDVMAYMDKHFASEEKLMKKRGYPRYEEHKNKHVKMRAKVESLIRDYKGGQVAMTFAVLKFLQDWLIKHIMERDKDYGKFFNRKGLK